MTTLKTSSRLAFAAAALAAFSTAASADEVAFRFHADDLSDARALYDRMADAAEAACDSSGIKSLRAIRAERECAAGLLEDFVAGAASPSLTAVHEQSTGARLAALR